MASVNKVIILGNLGRDPEIRYTSDERAIANLSLATSSRYKDKGSGELKEQTEWHKIVLYNRLAEIAREYLKKGQSVYVEGRLQTRKWQDQNGSLVPSPRTAASTSRHLRRPGCCASTPPRRGSS